MVTQSVSSHRHAIASDLRNQITTGRIKAGERLPSETRLATHYTVSTATLRSALAVLQSEGLVEKIHGKGNFVRHPLRRITYVGGACDTAAMPSFSRISIRTTHVQAHGQLIGLLRVPANSQLTEYFCLGHEEKSPHSFARIYVPPDLSPAEVPDEAPCFKTIQARLEKLRPPLAEIQEQVTARHPTPEEAAILRISSTLAVLAITRVTTDRTGRVVEATLSVLPGDRAHACFTTHHTTEEKAKEHDDPQ